MTTQIANTNVILYFNYILGTALCCHKQCEV